VAWSKEQKTTFARGMKHLETVLSKNGVQVFLTGGTLLGAVREHGIIAIDKDIDMAYLSKKKNVRDVMLEFENKIKPSLEKSGFAVRNVANLWQSKVRIMLGQHYVEENRYTYFTNIPNVWFDLWTYWFDEHGLNVVPCFSHEECWEVSDFLPLKETDFEGYKFLIPKYSEKFLIRLYGKDWKIPQSKRSPWNGYFQQRRLIVINSSDEEYKKVIKSVDFHDLIYLSFEDVLENLSKYDVDGLYVPVREYSITQIGELVKKARGKKVTIGLVGRISGKLVEKIREGGVFWVK